MGMMQFSDELHKIFNMVHEEALREQSREILPDHYILAILRNGKNAVTEMLAAHDVDLGQFESYVVRELQKSRGVGPRGAGELPMSAAAMELQEHVLVEAEKMGSKMLEAVHLFLALLGRREESTFRFLEEQNYDCDLLRTQFAYKASLHSTFEDFLLETFPGLNSEIHDLTDGADSGREEAAEEESESYDFSEFCVDLTQQAQEGKLDPIIGRTRELERLIQVLCRRKKNNPVIIGEPGVGKTALVEGLAQRIVSQNVPQQLLSKRIFMLDMNSVIAGTKYRGQFEERMKNMLEELAKRTDVILYIDELHSIVGAGAASGTLDAANILKQPLARGELQCIGSTTRDDYRKQIESDAALARRFQKVELEPCDAAMTLQILERLRPRYEQYHRVRYTPEALEACVSLTQRYLAGRAFPDKAIDAMDEVGARVTVYQRARSERMRALDAMLAKVSEEEERVDSSDDTTLGVQLARQKDALQAELLHATNEWRQHQDKYIEVSAAAVASVVSMMTNIPVESVQTSESERLLKMEEAFFKLVIGQDEAVSVIARAIRRNRSGLRDPNRPIGSFLFMGSTGVGKTYLAKVLANYLFESEKSFIRVDMSEFHEKSSISRLLGTSPGYIGYEEGGQLTEQVRHHPYSVVLFDEIEKAAPEVYNVLLQILDDGHLTDGGGRVVDFRNTIIIMTSNVGSRSLSEFGDGIGFVTPTRQRDAQEYRRRYVEDALRRHFPPEFLNRVDELVFFNSLDELDVKKILEIELAKIEDRLRELGRSVTFTAAARAFLAREGYDSKYGARPLRRAIQRHVEDLLADELLRAKLQDEVVIDYREGQGTYLKSRRVAQALEAQL